jgi:hypothetical protein
LLDKTSQTLFTCMTLYMPSSPSPFDDERDGYLG